VKESGAAKKDFAWIPPLGAPYLSILTWLLPFSALFFSLDAAKKSSWILYAAQTLFFLLAWNKTRRLESLLSPVALVILYIDISFALGNYAFGRELVLNQIDYADFLKWRHLPLTTFYVLMQNVLLFHFDGFLRARAEKIQPAEHVRFPVSIQAGIVMGGIGMFLLFTVLPLDVGLLGGSGEMSAVPKTIGALLLIGLMVYRRVKWRFLAYIVILGLFASFSYNNKREAIFLVLPIFLLEAAVYRRALKASSYIYGLLVAAGLSVLIIVMSMMRGYGGLATESTGLFGFLPLVWQYVLLDDFLPYFLNNIEASYTYFHSLQAMEYILGDPSLLTYGSTVVKFLFIAIPSSILSWKPSSFIDLYTSFHDPEFRAVGGSWPPNVFGEMFWNFHFAGLFVLPCVLGVISIGYYKMLRLIRSGAILNHIWLLYAYMHVLTYARGSGLDLLLIYSIFGALFGYFVNISLTLLSFKELPVFLKGKAHRSSGR
jgi:hypothetical protein